MANYTDLTKTNYPNSLDDRPTAIDELNRNTHFSVNVNFEDRDSLTNPTDYIVLADDVNALQESIIAVQRSLGAMPQGTNIDFTVDERILSIENFTMKGESSVQGYLNLDERYMWGGSRPNIGETPVPLVSIVGHSHDGSVGQADKIDLSSHVSGLLSKYNIDITSGGSSMLTAQDIKISSASTETIPEALAKKMDKTGGSFEGNIVVEGSFNTLMNIEIDAKDTFYETGKSYVQSGSDNYAFSGYARKAGSAALTGTLSTVNAKLRYGKYVSAFRMKSSDSTSAQSLCKILVKDSVSNTNVAELILQASDFDTVGEYKTFYLEFDHKNITGTSERGYIVPEVYFYTGIADLSVDSIVIVPITTAVYDDDIS